MSFETERLKDMSNKSLSSKISQVSKVELAPKL
jgi:hypothetical protein